MSINVSLFHRYILYYVYKLIVFSLVRSKSVNCRDKIQDKKISITYNINENTKLNWLVKFKLINFHNVPNLILDV